MKTIRISADSSRDIIFVDEVGHREEKYLDEWYKIEDELKERKYEDFIVLECAGDDSWTTMMILLFLMNKGYIVVLTSPLESRNEIYLKKSVLI